MNDVGVGGSPPRRVPAGAGPMAARLVLLAGTRHRPTGLTAAVLAPAVLAEAGRTPARWGHAVASRAQAPSKPGGAEILGRALTGLRDALAGPAGPPVLAGPAGPSVPDSLRRLVREACLPLGSEAVACLDRVLGLDLTRQVGWRRQPGPET
jgi:hypothetical protein